MWFKCLLILCLNLVMGAAVAAPSRSQTPKPPFPYTETELEFDSSYDAGVHLVGTLVIPYGKGPFPAVLLLNGSGQQDRDYTVFGHKPFLILADYLARRGIASLRMDDRGAGKSRGALANLTTEVSAVDAAAAFGMLRGQAGVDATRVGVLGHSEGALIAAMVAADPSNRVAFVAMLAGPGQTYDRILQSQVESISRVNGETETVTRSKVRAQIRLNSVVVRNPGLSTDELMDALVKVIQDMSPQTDAGTARRAMQSFAHPWMRFYLAFDPSPLLTQVRRPVLAMNGEKDLQVRARDNLAAIEKALVFGGNKDVTTMVIPGVNHLFQTAETGLMSEYEKIDETFAPQALKQLGDWLEAHSRPKDK